MESFNRTFCHHRYLCYCHPFRKYDLYGHWYQLCWMCLHRNGDGLGYAHVVGSLRRAGSRRGTLLAYRQILRAFRAYAAQTARRQS